MTCVCLYFRSILYIRTEFQTATVCYPTLPCALSSTSEQVTVAKALQTFSGVLLCCGQGRVMLRSTESHTVTSPLDGCLVICLFHSTDICSRAWSKAALQNFFIHCVGSAPTESTLEWHPLALCRVCVYRELLGLALEMLPSALLVRSLFDCKTEGIRTFVSGSLFSVYAM